MVILFIDYTNIKLEVFQQMNYSNLITDYAIDGWYLSHVGRSLRIKSNIPKIYQEEESELILRNIIPRQLALKLIPKIDVKPLSIYRQLLP